MFAEEKPQANIEERRHRRLHEQNRGVLDLQLLCGLCHKTSRRPCRLPRKGVGRIKGLAEAEEHVATIPIFRPLSVHLSFCAGETGLPESRWRKPLGKHPAFVQRHKDSVPTELTVIGPCSNEHRGNGNGHDSTPLPHEAKKLKKKKCGGHAFNLDKCISPTSHTVSVKNVRQVKQAETKKSMGKPYTTLTNFA